MRTSIPLCVFLLVGLACSAANRSAAAEAVTIASFAGSGTDSIQAMATDSAGNLYVAGTTSSLDFPVKAAWQPHMGDSRVMRSLDSGATWQAPPFGSVTDVATGPACAIYASRKITSDAFVAKLGPDGNQVLWATFLGGRDQDAAKALALNANGNVWIAGSTRSLDFPVTQPRIGVSGIQNAFVAEFSPDGALLSSVVFGGEEEDTPVALAVDGAGAAYVVGFTDSAQFPVTPGALVTQLNNNEADGFLVELGPDGQLAYGSYLGGSSNTAWPAAIAVGADGQPFIGGSGIVAGQVAPANEISTGFLARIDTASSQVTYFARMGGTLPEPNAGGPGATGNIQVDSQGQVAFSLAAGAGFPRRDAAPETPGLDCLIPQWGGVAKLSADGSSLLFSTYLDMCGAPALAVSPGGSLFAGVGANADVVEIEPRPDTARAVPHPANEGIVKQ